MRFTVFCQVLNQVFEVFYFIIVDLSVLLVLRKLLKELGYFDLFLVNLHKSVQSKGPGLIDLWVLEGQLLQLISALQHRQFTLFLLLRMLGTLQI